MGKEKRFEEKMQRVEELITSVESWPDAVNREAALELVQTLMDFHGAGIERMMDITANAGSAGYAIFDDLARDDLVSNLLMLYGLHPIDIKDRVLNAIEKVRPSLNLHEGDVELLGINDGVVNLRLKGSCNGCPSSALTLKHTIEEAIYAAAPDVTAIEVEGAENAESNGFVQIGSPKKNVYTNCEFVASAG
ncbi:MAG: NifU family protein [Acidobacteriota bacterium]